MFKCQLYKMKKPKVKRNAKPSATEDVPLPLEDPRAVALRTTLLEVVDNQLREENPPETKQTYERLLRDGYTDEAARKLIAAVVSREIFDILKHQQPFNHTRYLHALKRLPRLPWE